MSHKLRFGKQENGELEAYVDSAYANSTGSRSTSANVFTLYGNPVSWSSRKESIVAQSSTEAEYVALADAMKQMIWIRHFLSTVWKLEKMSTVLLENNQGAIKLSGNPGYHSKTKHIQVRYHAIRDAVSNGNVRVQYKPNQAHDCRFTNERTKAVGKETMDRLVGQVGLKT